MQVILFTSPNIHYLIDRGGQFNENYYGMKYELMDLIVSDQMYIDMDDETKFKQTKFSEILGESKTVLYAPHYLLQVLYSLAFPTCRRQALFFRHKPSSSLLTSLALRFTSVTSRFSFWCFFICAESQWGFALTFQTKR